MSKFILTEDNLRRQLNDKMSSAEIEVFIDRYIEASSLEIPDANAVSRLSERRAEVNLFRVSFTLTSEEYEILSVYFGEDQRPGNFLVRAALEEFINRVAS